MARSTRANNAEADYAAESVEEKNSAKKNVGEVDLVRAPKCKGIGTGNNS
ncbi:MAG: hypothetical protein GY904_19310 [Planctomycetaceae bacterium]|nr:hypothetical protein [Planctomycetaceae bacterium]